jgi:hypothetical protein
MGAVLGIAAFGRTQEKLNGANNGGAQTATTGFSSGTTAPSAPSTGFGAAPSTSFTPAPSWGTTPTAPAASGFGSSSGFGATTTPGPVASSSGKLGPAPQQDPVL